MFNKPLASLLSISLFAPAASAQTLGRAAAGGVGMTPMTVNSLHSGVQTAPVLSMPVLSPNAMTMSPALAPTVLPTQLAPVVKAMAATPVVGSPLSVIQSDKIADKAPALDALFDQTAQLQPFPAAPATEYESLKSAIKARGVKAEVSLQASRTQREGRYWFTVNILGTASDVKEITNLFESANGQWSYAGIPLTLKLRGTLYDPAFGETLPQEFMNTAVSLTLTQNTRWLKNAKAEFKKKYISGFDGVIISLPAESKIAAKEDLAKLPMSVQLGLSKLSRFEQSGAYKLTLSKKEVYALYMHDGLVSEEVWLFDKDGNQFANGTAEEVGGFHWERQEVKAVNSGIAGGAIFQAVSEFKKKNSAHILAIKGVAGVGIGTAKGPVGYAVLLVKLDGTAPQETVDAAIKALPGYNGSLIHIRYEMMGQIAAQTGGQNIMSQIELNSLFNRWKPNFAGQAESGKVGLQSRIIPTAVKSNAAEKEMRATIDRISANRFLDKPESDAAVAVAVMNDAYIKSKLIAEQQIELVKELLDYSNHRLSAGEIITLFIARASAATPDLDNKVDHHSPLIKLYMYQNLVKAGLNPIADVRELMKPGAQAALLKAGFKRQADVEGTKIYFLKGAGANNGQRASFYKNGAASLYSVSKPESQLFTETISIDADGYIFNETVAPTLAD